MKALELQCVANANEESISFGLIVTNNENIRVKIRYITIYIDGVEVESIYCNDYLLEPSESTSLYQETVHVSAGWHTYHIEINGFRWDSFWGIWWPETWKWPSHQIEVPQKYNPIPDILKGILIASAVLILLGTTFYFIFLRPRRIKETLADYLIHNRWISSLANT